MQKKLFNRYEYDPQKDLLGKGGFAKVFKAFDTERNRYVALKFYKGASNEKYDIIGEINRMEDIRHPNLVKYYDARSINHIGADGTETKEQIGIMEYANNGNLTAWTAQLHRKIAHIRPTAQKYPYIAAAIRPLAKGILSGLAFLHQNNILHRDIKPANILLHQEGEQLIPKIADFGLSKEITSSLSSIHGLKGTIEYMAPEQLYPQKYAYNKKIQPNADLWAFGIILYELFAQHIPVGRRSEGSTIQEIMENLDLFDANCLIALQDIPMPYRAMIQACLVKFPQQRIQTADELLKLLEEGKIPHYIRLQTNSNEDTITDIPIPIPIPKAKKKEIQKSPPIHKAKQTVRKPSQEHQNSSKSKKYLPILAVFLLFAFIGIGLWNSSLFKTEPTIVLSPTLQELEQNMVKVPGGSFNRGCDEQRDGDCQDDEKPVHSVTLSTFEIGRYEITQAQWQAVMGDNPSHFKDCGSNCPVENVSWNDIQTFLQKLNKMTGKTYRLPTEAEWEFAARGGNSSQGYRYSGSNNLDKVAWYWENANGKTHPVGGKIKNELGLYDMSGNVREWCADGYDENYYANSPSKNPRGTSRVLRGGSWVIHLPQLRLR